MENDTKTAIWRALLLVLGCFNACTYAVLVLWEDESAARWSYKSMMRALAFPYVFQTTWRCIFISDYVHRSTISDHPLNSVLVARLLAAVGEFCFGVQLALGIYIASLSTSILPSDVICVLAVSIVLLDGVGQCCATYGTIMGSTLPFVLEAILWSCIFSISLVMALSSAEHVEFTTYEGVFLSAVITLVSPALAYMLFGYCPLCWEAWRKEVHKSRKEGLLPAATMQSQSFRSKAWEALTLRVPTQDWRVWEPECTWQTLYFTVGTWSSLGLMVFPLQ